MNDNTKQTQVPDFSDENFEELLKESISGLDKKEGTVIDGTVAAMDKDAIIVDVGLKTEGRISRKEFGTELDEDKLKIGDKVQVYLDRIENSSGEAVLSREKVRREQVWDQLKESFENKQKVRGIIVRQVKGGFTIDIDGVRAFLPHSQTDTDHQFDIDSLIGTEQEFQILQFDRDRSNVVVSRREAMEKDRTVQKAVIIQTIKEDQIIEGTVKNIMEYGAFVDLGGIDGLLHVTDISWKRVTNPAEVLQTGQKVEVKVVKVVPNTQRISLSMKHLEPDPWENIEAKYPLGTKVTGRVTNVADYGAFVELEDGVEGLIHVSEMSWAKRTMHPSNVVSTSQEVEVVVLNVDSEKRRVSLGLKQANQNPWQAFAAEHASGDVITGEIKTITEFGMFVELTNEIDGLVHIYDLDWNRSGDEVIKEYETGQTVDAMVLEIDTEKERVSLGIKQLADDPYEKVGRKGSVVTCEVLEIKDAGLSVKIGDSELTGFIKRGDLGIDRDAQRPDRFAVGDRQDAKITQIDRKTGRIQLSIKALEIAEEKEAVAQYGSSDTGAVLGDILGAALKPAADATAEGDAAEGDDSGEESAK